VKFLEHKKNAVLFDDIDRARIGLEARPGAFEKNRTKVLNKPTGLKKKNPS